MPKLPVDAVEQWSKIPEEWSHHPIALLDLDGTLRGDVLPMVRLAQPLLPPFLNRWPRFESDRETARSLKIARFGSSLLRLWTLRTFTRHHRRRYKHLFSELHMLAANVLQDANTSEVRKRYRQHLQAMDGIWWPSAISLLREITSQMVVILVTGSEQVQTEECVRILAAEGIDTSRIFVRGSRYSIRADGTYSGSVEHLNVTLEGKRDAVRDIAKTGQVQLAVGNSRPDRALFECLGEFGANFLVAPAQVAANRNGRTFTLRKMARCGYDLRWADDDAQESQNDRKAICVVDETLVPVLDWVGQQEQQRVERPSVLEFAAAV